MLIITISKMSNASGCYPVAKSNHDNQGSRSEQLRSFCLQQCCHSMKKNPRIYLEKNNRK